MISIADVFGMAGMGLFLVATIKQWHKIYKTQHTTAISLTHYRLKIVAIVCSLICFGLAKLPLSFIVVSLELLVSLGIIHMLVKYRQMKEMPSHVFLGELKKW